MSIYYYSLLKPKKSVPCFQGDHFVSPPPPPPPQQQVDSRSSSRGRLPSLISFKHQCHHDQQQQSHPRTPRHLAGSLLDAVAFGTFAAMSPSQNEFMRQFELMNVATLGVEVQNDSGVGETGSRGGVQEEEVQEHAAPVSSVADILLDPESIQEEAKRVDDPDGMAHQLTSSQVEVRANPSATVLDGDGREGSLPQRTRWKLWNPEMQPSGQTGEEDDDGVDLLHEVLSQEEGGGGGGGSSLYFNVSAADDQNDSPRKVRSEGEAASPEKEEEEDRGRGKRVKISNRRYAASAASAASGDEGGGKSAGQGKEIVKLAERRRGDYGEIIVCPTCHSRYARVNNYKV